MYLNLLLFLRLHQPFLICLDILKLLLCQSINPHTRPVLQTIIFSTLALTGCILSAGIGTVKPFINHYNRLLIYLDCLKLLLCQSIHPSARPVLQVIIFTTLTLTVFILSAGISATKCIVHLFHRPRHALFDALNPPRRRLHLHGEKIHASRKQQHAAKQDTDEDILDGVFVHMTDMIHHPEKRVLT